MSIRIKLVQFAPLVFILLFAACTQAGEKGQVQKWFIPQYEFRTGGYPQEPGNTFAIADGTVKEITVRYNSEISQETGDSGANLTGYHRVTYLENGNISSVESESDGVLSRSEYVYDDSELLELRIDFREGLEENRVTFSYPPSDKYTFKVEVHNSNLQTASYYDRTEQVTYFEQENMVESDVSEPAQATLYRFFFENDHVVKKTLSNEFIPEVKEEYQYDNAHMVGHDTFNVDGDLSTRTVFQWDNDGNTRSSEYYEYKSGEKRVSKTVYSQHDANGNWKESTTEYTEGGSIIVYRELEYY